MTFLTKSIADSSHEIQFLFNPPPACFPMHFSLILLFVLDDDWQKDIAIVLPKREILQAKI